MHLRNKKAITFGMLIAITVLIVTAISCSGEITFTFYNYSGKAVNVKSASTVTDYWKSGTNSLAGAVVKLYPYNYTTGAFASTHTASATVDSTGNFTFSSLKSGKYRMTGELSGWIFVPRLVEVYGENTAFPNLLAYYNDSSVWSIVTSWESPSQNPIDVDCIMTYGPDPGTRTSINFSNKTSPSNSIVLDRDVDTSTSLSIPRVETMSIYNATDLNDGDILYFYLISQTASQLTGNTDSSIPASYAQVDVMYGSTHYGTWIVPWNSSETRLRLLRFDYDSNKDVFPYVFNLASAFNAQTEYGGIKKIEF